MDKPNDKPAGVPLISKEDLELADYQKRKKKLLQEIMLLEKTYKIKLGAEIRIAPNGVFPVIVTFDMAKKPADKATEKPSN